MLMRTKTGNMKKMLFLIGCLLTALSSSPYVVTLQDELWIAPSHEVAGYVRERDNATVTTTDEDENNIVLSVSTTLEDKAMFAYPLTLLVETCADAATQDGNSLTVKYKGGQTIVSGVNPNGGAVTIHKSSATPLLI